MCEPTLMAALGALGAGGATTAAGATGAAVTAGSALSTVGALATAGGTLYSGLSAMRQGRAQADMLEAQADQERAFAAVEEQRVGRRFGSQIATQRAELAARGVDLSSPTAVYLGENAAREMSFAQQEVRSRGSARTVELNGAASAARARGRQAFLSGGLSAAGSLLSAGPDLWPGLYDKAVTP